MRTFLTLKIATREKRECLSPLDLAGVPVSVLIGHLWRHFSLAKRNKQRAGACDGTGGGNSWSARKRTANAELLQDYFTSHHGRECIRNE